MGFFDRLMGGEHVHPKDAAQLIEQGATLLDVREHHEFHAGHVPGARHFPLSSLNKKIHQLPKEGTLLVICRSGARSSHVAAMLRKLGLDARNVAGGMHAWARSGLPVRSKTGEPGRVV
jgi:rhodanese-related sulfurtransferase